MKEEIWEREQREIAELEEIRAQNGGALPENELEPIDLRMHPRAKITQAVRLSPVVSHQLSIAARQRDMTVSALIREFIDAGLKEYDSAYMREHVRKLEERIAVLEQEYAADENKEGR